MKYYSTNKQAPLASLEEAVVKGLAGDKGLYMPEHIRPLDKDTISGLKNKSFHEIACTAAQAFFGEDIEPETLDAIVRDTLSFETPVVPVRDNIYSLELFHGPTLAFKDVGGRFMARLLGYFIKKEGLKQVNVLVATSGDTGSAVANGFLGVPGIHVYVLYPKGKVSPIQECQFTTLGQNITALEVDGTFDDCQALVKSAFMDEELNRHMKLTSANSINVARFLPQSFYYFNAYAQLDKIGKADQLVVSVPVETSAISQLVCLHIGWGCRSNVLWLPTTATTCSWNTCTRGFTRRVPPFRPSPMRWMSVIRATSPASWTCTARTATRTRKSAS